MVRVMLQESLVENLETRAKRAGLSIRDMCALAGVHPTTFSRWKRSDKNPNPVGANLASVGKIEGALSEFERRLYNTERNA